MTTPSRPSGPATLTEAFVTGRHGRTIMGIALMTFAGLYVLAIHVFGGLLHISTTTCATAWVQVVQEWGFPALLFVAGYRLFDIDSFTDLVNAAKAVLPGRAP